MLQFLLVLFLLLIVFGVIWYGWSKVVLLSVLIGGGIAIALTVLGAISSAFNDWMASAKRTRAQADLDEANAMRIRAQAELERDEGNAANVNVPAGAKADSLRKAAKPTDDDELRQLRKMAGLE